MKIQNYSIGSDQPVFIIAEIGNNHNGSMPRAKEMIDRAQACGADCVKFQMRHLGAVYRQNTLQRTGEDLGTEYVLDLLDKFELGVAGHKELAEYASEKGVLYLCTPWDELSVDALETEIAPPAYKVASADLTNLVLLDRLARTKKPLILSTGMSRESEIEITVNFLKERGVSFALLHCNSTYPAPYSDINLRYMHKLSRFAVPVGYSGHERGIGVTLAAVGLGATIIERHFTLDRHMEGPDHAASLEPADFEALVTGVRQIEEALGDGLERVVSQGEMMNRENLAKSLVAAREIKSGEIIQRADISVKSPGQGLSPQYLESLIGKTARRDLAFEDYFFQSDLSDTITKARPYKFDRPWGIPVRYHDFQKFAELSQPDLYEFHLSYKDMDLNPGDFLKGPYECDFVVHAPELFEGSHLMDLATDDAEYRANSMRETQRVIDITRALKEFFPNTKRPMIVANVGGFSMDARLDAETVTRYYKQFAKSMSELDLEGVELIPQTMAPFPWHFGGQRYQNMFVMADEIVSYCQQHQIRMCLDVSHSRLTCNHFELDFYDFVERLAPITGHLHLGDSSGTNGEGLQIGEGDIDFDRMCSILNKGAPGASFIPEIWQGHKNDGEGFWIALERLEGRL